MPHVPVTRVTYTYDVDSKNDIIEVTRENHKDFVYASPKGQWNNLNFAYNDNVSYADFLKALVRPNLEVCRKIALLRAGHVVDRIYGIQKDNKLAIKLMNCLKIIDPSFEPPIINLKCGWQKKLLDDIVCHWSRNVIVGCNNMYRLERFSNVLQVL
jgi:hypothetical protein